jgi:glutathione peroxidase
MKIRFPRSLVFLIAIAFGFLGSVAHAADSGSQALYEIPLTTIDGEKTSLKPYQNQVLLIVNTASGCGYTPQYAGLEKLYEKYRSQGLVVLGFPSNDFFSQEPGTNSQIKFFCKSNYHVEFPLFEKAPVGGDKIQPLYQYLLSHGEDHSAIGWNFEKILVGRNGQVLKRFRSRVSPESDELVKGVEEALRAPVPMGPSPSPSPTLKSKMKSKQK